MTYHQLMKDHGNHEPIFIFKGNVFYIFLMRDGCIAKHRKLLTACSPDCNEIAIAARDRDGDHTLSSWKWCVPAKNGAPLMLTDTGARGLRNSLKKHRMEFGFPEVAERLLKRYAERPRRVTGLFDRVDTLLKDVKWKPIGVDVAKPVNDRTAVYAKIAERIRREPTELETRMYEALKNSPYRGPRQQAAIDAFHDQFPASRLEWKVISETGGLVYEEHAFFNDKIVGMVKRISTPTRLYTWKATVLKYDKFDVPISCTQPSRAEANTWVEKYALEGVR